MSSEVGVELDVETQDVLIDASYKKLTQMFGGWVMEMVDDEPRDLEGVQQLVGRIFMTGVVRDALDLAVSSERESD
ncbi:hypothetical protein F7U66_01065 [Vibrio parahaemolyticus]|nr:hypothetical protein [Vibrio parahaemolyticus]